MERYCKKKKLVNGRVHCWTGSEWEWRNRWEKDGTPDGRDRGSRWTSIVTDGIHGTSPSHSAVRADANHQDDDYQSDRESSYYTAKSDIRFNDSTILNMLKKPIGEEL